MLHLFQLQLSRATPALLFLYMAAMAGVGLLGLTGCWQQSANKLILTAAIQVGVQTKTYKNTNTNKHKNTSDGSDSQVGIQVGKQTSATNKQTNKQTNTQNKNDTNKH